MQKPTLQTKTAEGGRTGRKVRRAGRLECESDAAILLSGLGVKEDKHSMLMGDLSGKEKCV